jgi:autotransporter translocation and assembly factor TamB
MWKKIGLGFLALLVVLAIVIAMQPSEFKIQRAQKVTAPPGVVYLFVQDFHRWSVWSPWEKLDPSLKRSYSGAKSGEGAVYDWVGNDQVGAGRMTIEKATNSREVQIKLEFLKPFAATNQTVFLFEKNGEQTVVTWTMTGKNDFVGKAFSLFMDMDALVGADFEKGLEGLKRAAEGEVKKQEEDQAAREAELERQLHAADAARSAEAAVAAAAATRR